MLSRVAKKLAKAGAFGIVAVSSAACFASTSSLEEVRDDLASTRAEASAADSVRTMQLFQIMNTLRNVTDSISALSQRVSRVRAETDADVRAMREQVNQVLEVSGQSEARLRELRSQLDARIRQSATATTSTAAAGDTAQPPKGATPGEPAPSAEDLYRIGSDQLTRGGNSAARSALSDLLKRYPKSELAADAQFLIAESYAAEGTIPAADSAYAAVVSKYADSPRAPTALYKRGVMAQTARRTTTAKRLYNELIRQYPSSDEAELARERLRILG